MLWIQPRPDLNSLSHLLPSVSHSLSTGTITTTIITITEVKMLYNTSCPLLGTIFNLSQQQFLRWILRTGSISGQCVMWIVCHLWFQVSMAD
jgi:hypothetical protein